LMMSLWDALRMNMMISYQELVRTFPELSFIDRRTFVLSAIGNCHGQVVDSPDNQRAGRSSDGGGQGCDL
ncbi:MULTISPECIES: hypothetical protein, partial [Enterobacteriaceae]